MTGSLYAFLMGLAQDCYLDSSLKSNQQVIILLTTSTKFSNLTGLTIFLSR